VRAELRRRPADAVVANFFVFGAQIAAEAERVPFAFLVSNLLSFPTSNTPPLGPGLKPARGPLGRARDRALNRFMARLFDKGLDQLNEVRRANGLEPRSSVLENFERADRLLLMTSESFEYEQFTPPPNVRIVGPRLDDPAWVGDWTPPAGDGPLVLVGMSSTFMDHAEVLQRVTTALGELPVRGLVTTGPAIPVESIDAPASVTVVERAPHSEVLRHASAVVTHAGHGTVIKALAAGVPVVALPMGRDQLDNAARVAHHGAGLRLKPKSSSATIARAVRRVLEEPSFGVGADRLGAAIAEETARDLAAEELELLAVKEVDVVDRGPYRAPSDHTRASSVLS
jgi:MGT family glycosyltransferase